jgi:hypothetical protein
MTYRIENFINKMPNWLRRLLALPAAITGFILVNFLAGLLIPKNYLASNMFYMNNDWIEKHIVPILAISLFEYLLSIAVFMIVLRSLVPFKKFMVVLIATIFWTILLLSVVVMESYNFLSACPWIIMDGMVKGIISILFLCVFTYCTYKNQRKKEISHET